MLLCMMEKLTLEENMADISSGSWNIWDTQFVNLVQGQDTVLDGHAVQVDKDNNVIETDNDKMFDVWRRSKICILGCYKI